MEAINKLYMENARRHIRFFYSEKGLLESLKSNLQKNNDETNLQVLKKIISLDFCSDIPLEDLQVRSVEYFIKLCEKYKLVGSTNFSPLEYFDLLNAIFHMIASKYSFSKHSKVYLLLNYLKDNLIIEIHENDELKSYSKIYINILSNYIIHNFINVDFIDNNKDKIENLFDQFEGLVTKDYALLYNIIAMDLSNINRMKRIHINSHKKTTIGYEDFSDLYSTLGKIVFWEILGINLDEIFLNQLFEKEFGRDYRYFYW